jgi:hypothetical protein
VLKIFTGSRLWRDIDEYFRVIENYNWGHKGTDIRSNSKIRGKPMNQDKKKEFYDTVDKFIDLANEIAKSDPSGSVGTALRFAAARYSAYEASLMTNNLAEDKDKQMQLFVNDFAKMLEHNIDNYISIQFRKLR